jgi:hypothetical protein
MNIDKNYQHLSKIFLELLTINQDFKLSFQTLAPEIYADIESASTNPNCSCRGKVENYVNSNREKCGKFLNESSSQIKSLINLQDIESKYRFVVYGGKVERVKVTEWSNFYQKLNSDRAAYRQFSLLRVDDEHVDVFFL